MQNRSSDGNNVTQGKWPEGLGDESNLPSILDKVKTKMVAGSF